MTIYEHLTNLGYCTPTGEYTDIVDRILALETQIVPVEADTILAVDTQIAVEPVLDMAVI